MGYAMRPLREEELTKYLEVLRKESERRPVYAAAAAIAIGTGARIGEVLKMRVKDVRGEDGKVREKLTRILEKKRGKVVYSDRIFPIEVLRELVQRYLDSEERRQFFQKEDDYLFSIRWNGKPLSYNHVYKVQQNLLREAGIPGRGIAFHGLRKSLLTMVYYERQKKTGDSMAALRYVQEIACHKSLDTTLRYVGWELIVDEKETIENCFKGIEMRMKKAPCAGVAS